MIRRPLPVRIMFLAFAMCAAAGLVAVRANVYGLSMQDDQAVPDESSTLAPDQEEAGTDEPVVAEPADTAGAGNMPLQGTDGYRWFERDGELAPWQLLALILLGMAAIAAAAAFVYSRYIAGRRAPVDDDPEGEWPLPPLVIPARLAPDGVTRPRNDLRSAPAAVGAAAFPREASATVPQPQAAGQISARSRPTLHPEAGGRMVPSVEQGELVQAGPIRFHRPPEGTLQLLPGRLEILSGNERHEEIRFVRVAGQDAVVTFGRSEGEPHLHIQLESRTVSRLHASIRFQEGRWYIANLSRTNPVVLNSKQMSTADAVHVALDDGDRIEMGEVIFRFRSR